MQRKPVVHVGRCVVYVGPGVHTQGIVLFYCCRRSPTWLLRVHSCVSHMLRTGSPVADPDCAGKE